MKYLHSLAAILNGAVFLCSAATLTHENSQLKGHLSQEKVKNYLSKALCSIDVKFVEIYYVFESSSEGRLLDGIIAENSGCVHPPLTIVS